MDIYSKRLAAKVIAFNKAHAEANRLQPLYVAALQPFLGKQIFVTGGLAHKAKKALAEIQSSALQVYAAHSGYNMIYIVKFSENYEKYSCVYAEVSFYVAKIDGLILTEFYPHAPLKTDYTVALIEDLREVELRTDRAHREAESALYPFGKYDN